MAKKKSALQKMLASYKQSANGNLATNSGSVGRPATIQTPTSSRSNLGDVHAPIQIDSSQSSTSSQPPVPSNEFEFRVDVEPITDLARALKYEKLKEARRAEKARRKAEQEDKRHANALSEYQNDYHYDSGDEDASCMMTHDKDGQLVQVMKYKKRQSKKSNQTSPRSKYQKRLYSSSEGDQSSSSSSSDDDEQYSLFFELPKHFHSGCFVRSKKHDPNSYNIDFDEPDNESVEYCHHHNPNDYAQAVSLAHQCSTEDEIRAASAEANKRVNGRNNKSADVWLNWIAKEEACHKFENRGQWPQPSKEIDWIKRTLEKLDWAITELVPMNETAAIKSEISRLNDRMGNFKRLITSTYE